MADPLAGARREREMVAEEVFSLAAALSTARDILDRLGAARFDPECDCCRQAQRIISGDKSWPL